VQLPIQKHPGSFAYIKRLPERLEVRGAGHLSGNYSLRKEYEWDACVWVKAHMSSSDMSCIYFDQKNEQWAIAADEKMMRELDYDFIESGSDLNSAYPGSTDLRWIGRDQRERRDMEVESERHWHPPKWVSDHPSRRSSRSDSDGRSRRSKGGRRAKSTSKRRTRRKEDSSGYEKPRKEKGSPGRSGRGDNRSANKGPSGAEELSQSRPGELLWMDGEPVLLEEYDRRGGSATVLIPGARSAKTVREEKIGERVQRGWVPAVHVSVTLSTQGYYRGQSTREHDNSLIFTLPPEESGAAPPWLAFCSPTIPPKGQAMWTIRVQRAADWPHPPRLDRSSDEPGGITVGFGPVDLLSRRAKDPCSWDALSRGSAFYRNPRKATADATATVGLCGDTKSRESAGVLHENDELRVLVDRQQNVVYFCRAAARASRHGDWELVCVEGITSDGELGFFVAVPPGSSVRVFPPVNPPPSDWSQALDLSRLHAPLKTAVRDLVQNLELLSAGPVDSLPRDDKQATARIADVAKERAEALKGGNVQVARQLPADVGAVSQLRCASAAAMVAGLTIVSATMYRPSGVRARSWPGQRHGGPSCCNIM